MGTVFVGDLHGRIRTLREIEKLDHYFVFMGDFLDSFTQSREDQIEVVREVLRLDGEGKARFLLGNHELSYANPDWRCSGWNKQTQHAVAPYLDQLLRRGLNWYSPGPGVLVTHAGVTARLWHLLTDYPAFDTPEAKLDECCCQINRASGDAYSWLYAAGAGRGGGSLLPGPFWCDWNSEFEPVSGLTQIVGHTAGVESTRFFKQTTRQGLRQTPNGDWNIDCLDLDTARTVLLYEEGALTPLPLGG